MFEAARCMKAKHNGDVGRCSKLEADFGLHWLVTLSYLRDLRSSLNKASHWTSSFLVQFCWPLEKKIGRGKKRSQAHPPLVFCL